MSECLRIQRLLSRYVDQEARESDAALVRTHLEGCSACRKEWAELARVKELIVKKERKTLPEELWPSRLRNALIREQNKAPDFSWDILGQFSRRLIPIPIGVILLSVGLLYWSVSQPMIRISTEDDILAGNLATTETALAVILGA
jgi:predicted anti-sigma-YlaC factor YlaD